MIYSILVLILGLLIGSFLNVCIYRIPKKESIVFGPSHCMSCNNRIKWYDLIPVLSYIFLGGKCRYCKEKISLQYPCIELANGLAYVTLYKLMGPGIFLPVSFVIFSTLLVLIMIKVNK